MSRRVRHRSWTARGRKGQVAAVAVLLTLMMLVTFIANYLTTTVPNQMSLNDFNHNLAVQNQVNRLSALLATSGRSASVGEQLTQPISLGSDGLPPWAAPDPGYVTNGYNGSNLVFNYGLLGLTVYGPPSGYASGGPPLPAGCAYTSPQQTSILCGSAGGEVAHNFSGNGQVFTVNAVGGPFYAFNFSCNNSRVYVNSTGSSRADLTLLGNNNVFFLGMNGGANINFTVIGSNNYINLGQTGGASVFIYMYGNDDSVYQGSTGGANVKVIIFGSGDTMVGNSTGGPTYTGFVTGFNASDPFSPLCPYDNLSGTDTLGGSAKGGATLNGTFNNSGYNGSGTNGSWKYHYQHVPPFLCPFFNRQPIAVANPAYTGAGLVVHLENTWAPSAEVAYDEGAVVYAQTGSYPVMINPPQFSVVHSGSHITAVGVWFPSFANRAGSISGIGTETMSLRLLHSERYTVGVNGSSLALNPKVPISMVVHTPYAEAWASYLSTLPVLSGLWSCAPVAICTGPYTPGQSLGTVTITIPGTYLQAIEVGTASYGLAFS